MKTVTIQNAKYQVSEKIYNLLNSVKHSNDCIDVVLFFGLKSGDIIPA